MEDDGRLMIENSQHLLIDNPIDDTSLMPSPHIVVIDTSDGNLELLASTSSSAGLLTPTAEQPSTSRRFMSIKRPLAASRKRVMLLRSRLPTSAIYRRVGRLVTRRAKHRRSSHPTADDWIVMTDRNDNLSVNRELQLPIESIDDQSNYRTPPDNLSVILPSSTIVYRPTITDHDRVHVYHSVSKGRTS